MLALIVTLGAWSCDLRALSFEWLACLRCNLNALAFTVLALIILALHGVALSFNVYARTAQLPGVTLHL